MNRISLILTSLLLGVLLPLSSAQTVEFSVSYPEITSDGPYAQVHFRDVDVDDSEVGLRVAAGTELQLGVRMRRAGSLATIGNLIGDLAFEGSTGGRYAAAVSARGVIGPVAARTRISVSDGLPPLQSVVEGELPPLPVLGAGGPLLGFELGGSYRASRALIVDLSPGLYLRHGQLAGRLGAQLRMVRLVGDDDLLLRSHLFASPGFDRAAGALGVGYTLNRRRAPSWEAVIWLGRGPDGWSPGATVSGAERFQGGRWDVQLAAEPYRLDLWPYRLNSTLLVEAGPGDLAMQVKAGRNGSGDWVAGGELGYRIPFAP